VAYSPFAEVVLHGNAAAAYKAFVLVVVAACKAFVPVVVGACKAFVPVVVAAYLAVVEVSILEVVYSLPGGYALSPVLEWRLILGSADLWAMKTFLAADVVVAVAFDGHS
jgi:hypothetical protein